MARRKVTPGRAVDAILGVAVWWIWSYLGFAWYWAILAGAVAIAGAYFLADVYGIHLDREDRHGRR